MSKKILAMFMATAMAATTFFGCGSTEEASKKDEGSSTTSTDEDASTKTDDEKVTLEVAVSGSAQEIAIHQQKFDLYMKEHPNVTIKPVDIGSERFQKLMTLIGADNAPDIIYLNEWTYVMANKGVLLGLNDLIEQEQFDTSVYPESLLTPLRYEGELYALPQEVSPFVIYYNKEMFEAANVPLPTDDWTIDEFYAAAEALTDPAEKVYGYRHPGAWAECFFDFVHACISRYTKDAVWIQHSLFSPRLFFPGLYSVIFCPDTRIQYISQNVHIFYDRKFFKLAGSFSRFHHQNLSGPVIKVFFLCDRLPWVIVSFFSVFFNILIGIHPVDESSHGTTDLSHCICPDIFFPDIDFTQHLSRICCCPVKIYTCFLLTCFQLLQIGFDCSRLPRIFFL